MTDAVTRQPATEQTTAPGPREPAAVALTGVEKTFGSHHVLRGLDLEVRQRETLVIIGRSGTGKSVLLRHIVGLELPDRGTVSVFGSDVAHLGKKEHSKLLRREWKPSRQKLKESLSKRFGKDRKLSLKNYSKK